MPKVFNKLHLVGPPDGNEDAARLANTRPVFLTQAAFDALEDPAGSGEYPTLANRLVCIIDADTGIGYIDSAEGYASPGTEVATGGFWVNGSPIYKTLFHEDDLTPGNTGSVLATLTDFAQIIRFEGFGNMADDGSGGTVPLGGSGFGVTVLDNGDVKITGPDGVTIYRLYVTVWYTKV